MWILRLLAVCLVFYGSLHGVVTKVSDRTDSKTQETQEKFVEVHTADYENKSSITAAYEKLDLRIKEIAPMVAAFVGEEESKQVDSEDVQIEFWKCCELPAFKMSVAFPSEHDRKEECYKTLILDVFKYRFYSEDPRVIDHFHFTTTHFVQVDWKDNAYRVLNVKRTYPLSLDDFNYIKQNIQVFLIGIIKEVLKINELDVNDYELILEDIELNTISAIDGVVNHAFEVTLLNKGCFFGKTRFVLFNSRAQYSIATILTEDAEHANEFLSQLFFGRLLEIEKKAQLEVDSPNVRSWDYLEVPNACMKIAVPTGSEILEDFTEEVTEDAFHQYFAAKHLDSEYYFHNYKNFKSFTVSEIRDYLEQICQEYEQQGYRIEFQQQPYYVVDAPTLSERQKHVNFVFDISLFKNERFQGKSRVVFLCDHTQVCRFEAFSNTRNSDKFVSEGRFFYIISYPNNACSLWGFSLSIFF